MEQKICTACKIIKDIGEFSVRKNRASGLSSHCKKCKTEEQKRYQKLDKSKILHKNIMLKQTYGITLEQYDKMVEVQNGLCYICGQPETQLFRGVIKRLSVDHNHTTGQIRKLLCDRCNTGMGKFEDNIELLNKVIQYLLEN